MCKCRILSENGEKTVIAVRGESVLDVLRQNGYEIYSPCGGNGTCGKCLVRVTGNVTEPDEEELRSVSGTPMRLACRTRILGDVMVKIGESDVQVCTDFSSSELAFSPMVTCQKKANVYPFLFRGNVIDISDEPSDYGVAVDIGTTTLAVYLCDGTDGRVLAKEGIPNPQSVYGGDVISRIDKIKKDPSLLEKEKRAVTDAINHVIGKLCLETGTDKSKIRMASVCGNTVMQHIFAGYDPSSIAVAPFIPKSLFENTCFSAADLGLDILKDAPCFLSPCIASYVGGDITCGIVATDLDRFSGNAVFLDIGTNGEIGLCGTSGMHFCAAAAGPAFEGANIECGMPGTAGAIDRVSYKNGLKIHVIGEGDARGICGSGLIDAVAVLLEQKVIDETGTIDGDTDLFRIEDDDRIYFSEKVYLTQKDIREIQLAKAAICAGILTLMKKASVSMEEVDRVFLAGGFGSRINPESACTIGLIPKALKDRIEFCGNTAGKGAVETLLSEEKRRRIAELKDMSEYSELSCDAFFRDSYIEQMEF